MTASTAMQDYLAEAYRIAYYQGDTDPIFVKYQNSVKPLGDVSLMVSALTDKFESHYFLSVDSSLLENKKLQVMMKLIEQGG